ncbi:MAG: DMT family transporter [Curvibacter sp.]|nr:MAG: DMT family transporter [Curvibacter sp.]
MQVTSTPGPNRWLACLCLAASMALVGSYVALSKPLTLILPIFLLAWLRFGIGAVAMLRWTRAAPDEPRMSSATKRLVFLESLLGNFLFSILMLNGVKLTSVVATGVIMSGIPACVALLSWIFLRERISGRVAAAIVLAVAGIAMFTLARPATDPASASAGSHWLGNLLIIGAVFCESAYAVIGKKLTGALSARRISALINLWGLALATPLGLYQAMSFNFSSVPAVDWLLLVFYALAASVWTVWLWMTGLRTIPAAHAGLFTVMLPITAAAVGVLFLGEPMTGVQMLAFGIALAGVVLATLPSSNTTPNPAH